MVVMIVLLFIALFVIIDLLRIYFKQKAKVIEGNKVLRSFEKLSVPLGLFFDKSHVWVRLNDSGEVRIGLDEFLIKAVGKIDRIETLPSGTTVKSGEKIAVCFVDGKRFVIKSPISGTIISKNESFNKEGENLSEDPYFSGWILKVWPLEIKESIKDLMIGKSAEQWMKRELGRFTDFLSRNATLALKPALADGAKPIVGAVSYLDEDGFNKFVEEFIESPKGE
jgi:glycine cleavage system H protein